MLNGKTTIAHGHLLLVSLILCAAGLVGFLAVHLGVSWEAAFKTIGFLYAFCFIPGYLIHKVVFVRFRAMPWFDRVVASLLLGVFVMPGVYFLFCLAGAKDNFPAFGWAVSIATPLVFGWNRLAALRLRATRSDSLVLIAALAIAVVWTWSMTAVELRADGTAYLPSYLDHHGHFELSLELDRSTPISTVPWISGFDTIAYHLTPNLWCTMLMHVTGAEPEVSYFGIAMTLRYLFVALALYIAFHGWLSRPASLAGVLMTLAVVGVSYPHYVMRKNYLFQNPLVMPLHMQFASAFGLIGLGLVLYYISLIPRHRLRVPILAASIVSVSLLWFKANFAPPVAMAVAIYAFFVLRKKHDLRWWLFCVSLQGVITISRAVQLSLADFRETPVLLPGTYYAFWWENLVRKGIGWPVDLVIGDGSFLASWPAYLQWLVVVPLCWVAHYHLYCIPLAGLVYYCCCRRGGRANPVAWLALLCVLCIGICFLIFPLSHIHTENSVQSMHLVVVAIACGVAGWMIWQVVRWIAARPTWVAVPLALGMLVLVGFEGLELKNQALYSTRMKSDVIPQDLYQCYRYLRDHTPNDVRILQPNYKAPWTAGMLSQRRVALETEILWTDRFAETRPLIHDIHKFYGRDGSSDACAILDRYGIDYFVVDLATGWEPCQQSMQEVFRQGDWAVFEVLRQGTQECCPSARAHGRRSEEQTDLPERGISESVG